MRDIAGILTSALAELVSDHRPSVCNAYNVNKASSTQKLGAQYMQVAVCTCHGHRPHLVTAFALRGRGVADRDRDLELPESGLALLLSSSLLLHRKACQAMDG